MARYDSEKFVDALEAILKSKMAAKIAAINSEKNDSITLTDFNTKAYFQYGIDENTAPNFNQFIVIGEQNPPEMISVFGAHAENVEIFIAVCISVSNHNNVNIRRLKRYTRCITEIIEENWDRIAMGHTKVSLQALPLATFDSQRSDIYYEASGATVTATLCG